MKPLFIPFSVVEYLRGDPHTSFCFGDFQYEYVLDEEITQELRRAQVEELAECWTAKKRPNHALRIAALVKLIQSGVMPHPVEIELSPYNQNLNYVTDGHHRIRALQYLKANGFYASLGGYEKLIKELKTLCKKHEDLRRIA